MRHVFSVRIGPVGFRIGSDWRLPIAQLETLYAGYPAPEDGVPDFTVRLFAARPWRRVIRPAVMIRKNSFGNRSDRGADTQAVLMSVYRTLQQRGHAPLKTVVDALTTYLETGTLPPLPPKVPAAG